MYRSSNDYRMRAVAIVARIIYIIPLAAAYLLLNIYRRLARWYVAGRAQSWSVADATVTGSYELDENKSILSTNGWDMDEYGDDDDGEYVPRLIVALQYSYAVEGELYPGIYFLPGTYADGHESSEDARAWANRKIIVRYDPSNATRSFFLEQDGAPGKPHLPRMFSYRPYITDLSLR